MALIIYAESTVRRIVSRHPTVTAAVAAEASRIAGRARRMLAQHRDTGATEIDVRHSKYDSYVGLNDTGKRAGMSIEFDHLHNFTGREVDGLHILHRAAGLL